LNLNIKSNIQSNRQIKNIFNWGLSSAPNPLQPLHDWLTGQTLLLNTKSHGQTIVPGYIKKPYVKRAGTAQSAV